MLRNSCVLVLLIALTACGGGGGGGNAPETTTDSDSINTTSTTINVVYSKGPVDGATAILLDANGNTVAGPVTTVDGQATFSNVSYSGLIYAQFSGGSYVDEATGATVNLPASFHMRSGVINNTGTSTLQLTASPLTEIGFQMADNAAGGTASLSNINTYIDQLADDFGLDNIDLTTVSPTAMQNIVGTSDADLYGTVLAAISQEQANASINPDSTALSNYITSTVSGGINQGAFSTAVGDLETNANTSNYINSTITQTIITNVNQTTVSYYSIGGSIIGLSGSVTLQNNGGDDLILSSNGNFTFSFNIANGTDYVVTVSSQPAGQTCAVSQETGRISGANITDVAVTCTDTTGSGNEASLIIQSFGVTTQAPSIVTAGFRILDLDGNPTNRVLTEDDFQVYEDGIAVDPNEAFLKLKKVENSAISKELKTVFMLDISTSLTNTDLDTVVTAVKNIIADNSGPTPVSKLQPDQSIAVYVFDSNVTQIVDFTNNVTTLINALNNIPLMSRGNSTNLIGAVETGVQSWNNIITQDSAEYGYMVIMTDGKHTSDANTVSDIAYLLEETITVDGNDLTNRLKDVYAVGVGTADIPTLKEIAGSDNKVTSIADVSTLETAFSDIAVKAQNSLEGLHYLYYATSRRSGMNNFQVKVKNAELCALLALEPSCMTNIKGSYNADGFEDVFPDIELKASKIVPLPGDTVLITAERVWTPASYADPVFSWDINAAHVGSATVTQPAQDQIEITFGPQSVSAVEFTVMDTITALSKTVTLYAAKDGIAVGYRDPYNGSYIFVDKFQFNQFNNPYAYGISELRHSSITSLAYSLPSNLNTINDTSYFDIKAFSGFGTDEFTYQVIRNDWLVKNTSPSNGADISFSVGPVTNSTGWYSNEITETVRVTNVTQNISKDFDIQWIHLPPQVVFGYGGSSSSKFGPTTMTNYLVCLDHPVGNNCVSMSYSVSFSISGMNASPPIPLNNYIYDLRTIQRVSGGSECNLKEDYAAFPSQGTLTAGPFTKPQTCSWNVEIRHQSLTRVNHRLTMRVESTPY